MHLSLSWSRALAALAAVVLVGAGVLALRSGDGGRSEFASDASLAGRDPARRDPNDGKAESKDPPKQATREQPKRAEVPTVAGDPLLPFPDHGLQPYAGSALEVQRIKVVKVESDRAFWIGLDGEGKDRLLVVMQEVADPPDVDKGDTVLVAGLLRSAPPDDTPLGLDDDADVEALRRAAVYIHALKVEVR